MTILPEMLVGLLAISTLRAGGLVITCFIFILVALVAIQWSRMHR